jgi:tripartite-type tricarboxylate transporter receptor subunit TctC
VKALAMLSKDRSPALPNLATAQKQGLADFEVANWLAFFLPKGTPDAIVRKLYNASVAALNGAPVQERLRQPVAEPMAPPRSALANLPGFVDSEIAKWSRIIKEANIKVE